MAASASVHAGLAALAFCSLAALLLVVRIDFVQFPLARTLTNVLALHLVIVLAALLITLPLLLSLFVIRRYAGFLVALAETRADISAGLWGTGLDAFAKTLAEDPTVKASSVPDIGLAYISPSLSHFPARERAALLGSPERIVTPKLRYFAVAIGAIWFVNFHQGDAIWDFMLLSTVVALLQAVSVRMALNVRQRLTVSLLRLIGLASGLLACQALPLISVEGLAYLSQHLTSAIVSPGGFGTPEGANYIRDIYDTFAEFFQHVKTATGGPWFVLATLISALLLKLLFTGAPTRYRDGNLRPLLVATIVFMVSIAVSYRFFQEQMYRVLRRAIFHFSFLGAGNAETSVGTGLNHLGQLIYRSIWSLSEYLNGPPILASLPWVRICLPHLFSVAAAILIGIRVNALGKKKTS